MRIVINHLTRMWNGVCAAGINLENGRHVRPVQAGLKPLSTTLLAANGGGLELGFEVDLGPTCAIPVYPETEDNEFEASCLRRVRVLRSDEFWSLLQRQARPKLRELFGRDLRKVGASSCCVDEGRGKASLGCLIPTGRPWLLMRSGMGNTSGLRAIITDGEFRLNLSVTDLRFYGRDHQTPDKRVIDRVNDRLAGDEAVILSVGLTRLFASSTEKDAVHWMQVNNIFFAGDPLWGTHRPRDTAH